MYTDNRDPILQELRKPPVANSLYSTNQFILNGNSIEYSDPKYALFSLPFVKTYPLPDSLVGYVEDDGFFVMNCNIFVSMYFLCSKVTDIV